MQFIFGLAYDVSSLSNAKAAQISMRRFEIRVKQSQQNYPA
jgi:hypothetical protein